jgi:general secretion pathway protein A
VLSNPTLEIADFYYYLALKLGLPFDGNKAKFLILFSQFIEKCRQEQRRVLLIFDEAHALPFELFQEIRFLANLPPEDQVALSIFLIGQPELLERLADERLLPLRQRVAIRFHIEPLSMDDTREYIFFRLERAGAVRRKLFTEKALELIHQATGGNPRLINILCDNALVSAFAADALVIDETIIRACTDELAIPGEQATFSLPRPASRMRPVWIAAAIAILAAMGLGLYLAYTNG